MYQGGRGTLPDEVIEHRLHQLMRIRAMLLGLIRSLRAKKSQGVFEP